MRIAVLSDIHGNTCALDAVLADLATRDINRIVNLGDCLYGPFDPMAVADRLIAEDWPTVAGNEDRILVEAESNRSISRTARFTFDRLAKTHSRWLSLLPGTRYLDGGPFACHGTPTDDTRYLLSRPTANGAMRPATESEIVGRLETIDTRLVLCGHDHLPRVVRLADGRTVANPGSVGCPAYTDDNPIPHQVENGSPHARYAIVTLCHDGSPDIELIAVPYDWNAAAFEAEANGFPDWASWLRTGRTRG